MIALWLFQVDLKVFVQFIYPGQSSSRGQNLGNAKPIDFAQGHADVRHLFYRRSSWMPQKVATDWKSFGQMHALSTEGAQGRLFLAKVRPLVSINETSMLTQGRNSGSCRCGVLRVIEYRKLQKHFGMAASAPRHIHDVAQWSAPSLCAPSPASAHAGLISKRKMNILPTATVFREADSVYLSRLLDRSPDRTIGEEDSELSDDGEVVRDALGEKQFGLSVIHVRSSRCSLDARRAEWATDRPNSVCVAPNYEAEMDPMGSRLNYLCERHCGSTKDHEFICER
jgi:hypothetical protein